MKHLISADAKIKVIATNRKTFEEQEKIMTYIEYVNMKRSYKFYYKALAV